MKCFYHSDLDGYCSGAIVKTEHPECEMFKINYGDEFPWDKIKKDETVYMVDFALQPFSNMEKLNKRCNLIWIDHHKTALEAHSKSNSFMHGIRLEGRAGCELTWQYIRPGEVMPLAVELLGRYDVWDKSVPEAWTFQIAMGVDNWDPNDIDKWKHLFTDKNIVEYLLGQGRVLQKYQGQQNENKAGRLAFDLKFEGINFIAANWSGNSTFFDSVYDENKHDGMFMFIWDKGKVKEYKLKKILKGEFPK